MKSEINQIFFTQAWKVLCKNLQRHILIHLEVKNWQKYFCFLPNSVWNTFIVKHPFSCSICEVCGSYQCPYCPFYSSGRIIVWSSYTEIFKQRPFLSLKSTISQILVFITSITTSGPALAPCLLLLFSTLIISLSTTFSFSFNDRTRTGFKSGMLWCYVPFQKSQNWYWTCGNIQRYCDAIFKSLKNLVIVDIDHRHRHYVATDIIPYCPVIMLENSRRKTENEQKTGENCAMWPETAKSLVFGVFWSGNSAPSRRPQA